MPVKPNILMSSLDAARLETLLAALPEHAFPGREALEAELERAEVVDPREIPPTVVTMRSTVRFTLGAPAKEHCRTLVYPQDVAADGDAISILAPVGSALIGLSQGDEIDWPRPGGGALRIRVEEVTYQPERAGEYFR